MWAMLGYFQNFEGFCSILQSPEWFGPLTHLVHWRVNDCINILYTLSATLGDGVGLVSIGYELVWDLHSYYLTDIVTKPLLQTSRTALRCPIRFLLRRPNRRQDRRSLRRSFPENLITCIVTLIPHVTHHVQSSRDSWLSRFHEVSELLSQPPPVSIRKTYSHTHNSRAAQ